MKKTYFCYLFDSQNMGLRIFKAICRLQRQCQEISLQNYPTYCIGPWSTCSSFFFNFSHYTLIWRRYPNRKYKFLFRGVSNKIFIIQHSTLHLSISAFINSTVVKFQIPNVNSILCNMRMLFTVHHKIETNMNFFYIGTYILLSLWIQFLLQQGLSKIDFSVCLGGQIFLTGCD